MVHQWREAMVDKDHKVTFGTLMPDGELTNVRQIKQSDMMKCPHFIMLPSHYRDDGSCRCNDHEHTEMADWGYTWKGGSWV